MVKGRWRWLKLQRSETVICFGDRALWLIFHNWATETCAYRIGLLVEARSREIFLLLQWIDRHIQLLTKGILRLTKFQFSLLASKKSAFLIIVRARCVFTFLSKDLINKQLFAWVSSNTKWERESLSLNWFNELLIWSIYSATVFDSSFVFAKLFITETVLHTTAKTSAFWRISLLAKLPGNLITKGISVGLWSLEPLIFTKLEHGLRRRSIYLGPFLSKGLRSIHHFAI